jgi:hypothetical protein
VVDHRKLIRSYNALLAWLGAGLFLASLAAGGHTALSASPNGCILYSGVFSFVLVGWLCFSALLVHYCDKYKNNGETFLKALTRTIGVVPGLIFATSIIGMTIIISARLGESLLAGCPNI